LKKSALILEGLPTLGISLLLTIILFIINPWLSIFGFGIILFILYFFRDPERTIASEEGDILSPADGLVTNIFTVEENNYLKQKAICVSIFMSPLDVHINRSPIKGQVEYIKYQKGRFIPATKPESHEVNEKNFIGIKNEDIKVLVVQIAGIMARRIVNWARIEQTLDKGDKIGMIKFSSGTQIYLPVDTAITIKKGDKLLSGITVIGRYSK